VEVNAFLRPTFTKRYETGLDHSDVVLFLRVQTDAQRLRAVALFNVSFFSLI
jgi:hypothetical protein